MRRNGWACLGFRVGGSGIHNFSHDLESLIMY
jgi:hypothetical protein